MTSNQITNQKHLNDYEFARINGYKGQICEYMQNKYKGYCEICERCDVEPMSYDEWRVAEPK